ncbi:MAG: DUF2239 family protein [Acidobacteriota bacterium]
MEAGDRSTCTAFVGSLRIASGTPAEVARAVRQSTCRPDTEPVLLFDDATGEQIDLRPDGSEPTEQRAGQEEGPEQRGPGRPRLGVVAREVTLLPRHWEWLAGQPGGASAALRRLVELARRDNAEKDRRRRAQEAAYRFMSALAGNLPDYEEALRALFAGDRARFDAFTESWPPDVSEYARSLALPALGG